MEKNQNEEMTIDKLAEMVARGFNDMGEAMDEMKQDIGSMKQDIGSMKQDIGSMKQDINLLKQGQERLEMRLQNVVYRSEMDAVLDRVQLLEQQMKIVLKKD